VPASRLLQRHWSRLDDLALAATVAGARSGLAAFSDVTRDAGSLIQSWVRGQPMVEFDHYPPDDVVDIRNGSQFFYHAHRSHGTEHGHLHLFWHASSSGRWRYVAGLSPRWGRSAPTHLLAIGLDNRGLPISVFTVNRWVTDGHWFDAPATLAMVDHFAVRQVPGHAASAAWLTDFVRFYRPVIEDLLVRRDRRMGRCAQLEVALQNRDIEVLSQINLDWAADLEALEMEQQRRRSEANVPRWPCSGRRSLSHLRIAVSTKSGTSHLPD
jgi:hypothetical protein